MYTLIDIYTKLDLEISHAIKIVLTANKPA